MSSNRKPGGALINRRQLLKAGMAGGLAATLSGCSLLPRKADYAPDQYVGAVGLPGGKFGISALNRKGPLIWESPVDTRCHSGCARPDGSQVIFFERRPGWAFYGFDALSGNRTHRVKAASGEHFVGHGVFSPDGRAGSMSPPAATSRGKALLPSMTRSRIISGSIPLSFRALAPMS